MSRLYLRLCESFAPALTFLRSGLESLTWWKQDTVKCFLFLYSCFYLNLDEIEDLENFVDKQEVIMTYSTHGEHIFGLVVNGQRQRLSTRKRRRQKKIVCVFVQAWIKKTPKNILFLKMHCNVT